MIGVHMIYECCFWDSNCRYVKLLTVVPQDTEALFAFFVLFPPAIIWIVSLFMSSISLIFSPMLSNKLLIASILFYISDALFFSSKVSFVFLTSSILLLIMFFSFFFKYLVIFLIFIFIITIV